MADRPQGATGDWAFHFLAASPHADPSPPTAQHHHNQRRAAVSPCVDDHFSCSELCAANSQWIASTVRQASDLEVAQVGHPHTHCLLLTARR